MRFGATVEDVAGWIPTVTLDATSVPADAQVLSNYIPVNDAEVSIAIGSTAHIDPVTEAALLTAIDVHARQLVAMMAAADAYDAHHPEFAADPKSYAATLRAKAAAKLDDLQSAVSRGTSAPDRDLAPNMGPAWVLPGTAPDGTVPPLFAEYLEPDPLVSAGGGASDGSRLVEDLLGLP